jgi:NADPH2:quinone reductase
VFATAGSSDKCAACERLGAERASTIAKRDFVEAIRELDRRRRRQRRARHRRRTLRPRNLDALAVEGRLVQIGVLGGAKTELNVAVIMQKRLTVTGSTLRVRSIADKARLPPPVASTCGRSSNPAPSNR